jgi:hypothetical protein
VRLERLSGVGRRELLAVANERAGVRVVTASELGIGKTIQCTQVRLGNAEIRRQIREMKILHQTIQLGAKKKKKKKKRQNNFRTLSRFSCAVSVALSSTLSSGAHAVCKASRDVAKRSRAARTASVAAPASVTSSKASNKCVAASTRRRCWRSASSLSKIFFAKKKKKKKKKKNVQQKKTTNTLRSTSIRDYFHIMFFVIETYAIVFSKIKQRQQQMRIDETAPTAAIEIPSLKVCGKKHNKKIWFEFFSFESIVFLK